MKSLKYIFLLVGASVIMTSCAPSLAVPGMATNNSSIKTGTAEVKIVFGITFGDHDLSIATAAKNGGIKKVATVDYKMKSGMFKKVFTTIVTGE